MNETSHINETCICKPAQIKCCYRPRTTSKSRYHVASNKSDVGSMYLIDGWSNLIRKIEVQNAN